MLQHQIQNEISNLLGKVVLACCKVYKADILKEKYDLNIDLSDSAPTDLEPAKRFIKKFIPCEVCGDGRIVHLCHIIPRAEGGDDSEGNLISLCASHHYLFDRHHLTKDEWNVINWDNKNMKAKEYALNIRYKKHEMYWKYNYPFFTNCECGNQDFDVYYTEKEPITRAGGIEEFPGVLTKHLKCTKCGNEYAQMTFKGMEYKWWQDWIRLKDK